MSAEDVRHGVARRIAELNGAVDERALARCLPYADAAILGVLDDQERGLPGVLAPGYWRAMLRRYALDRGLPWPPSDR